MNGLLVLKPTHQPSNKGNFIIVISDYLAIILNHMFNYLYRGKNASIRW